MRASWSRPALAVLGIAVLGGCSGTPAPAAQPVGAVDRQLLRTDPCGAYSSNSVHTALAPALERGNWPVMAGAPAQSRVSAHVVRCLYRFSPADPAPRGDQALRVFVYSEMNNGARLMEECKQRPLAGAAPLDAGDESCVDDSGQWRFRIGDQYVSVLIEVPLRLESGTRPITQADTATFVAPAGPADLADLGRPVAQDLALRLR